MCAGDGLRPFFLCCVLTVGVSPAPLSGKRGDQVGVTDCTCLRRIKVSEAGPHPQGDRGRVLGKVGSDVPEQRRAGQLLLARQGLLKSSGADFPDALQVAAGLRGVAWGSCKKEELLGLAS